MQRRERKVLKTRGLVRLSLRCLPLSGCAAPARARQLRVLPGRTRAESGRREAEPSGEPGPPLRVEAGGRAGAPGCPRSYREPWLGEAGAGASTAPQRALTPRSPPQKLGCKSGRRLVQRRHVSPGARGTRCASEAATPLLIFIHLLVLLYGSHLKAR